MARERITEEIYKLLLKGKRPSLGFEFARRIGLMEALWPDMAAMHGVQQEEKWHKEKDVWTHAMESADVMVEIADREIAEGKLPPPDMLEELDERMKLYREQKKKIFLFNQLKQEIVEKMGQSTLDLLIAKAKKLGEDAGDKFMNRVKAEAKEDAFNIERNKFKSANNDWENDPDFETKVFEMGSRHFYDEEKKRIDQWSHEMKSISLGVEDKEIRRLIDEEIGKMAADGVLSTERLAEMENFAGILADGATEIERNKQLKIMKDELKIVLVLTSTCHDLGKVTTTKFEDGRIRSKRHEQEGVEPMRRVLSVFDTTRFSPRMRAMMLPLIAEHLKPGMIYRDNFDIKSDQDEKLEDESVDTEHIDEVGSIEIKKAKKVKRIMIRLAKRIAEGDGNRGGEKKSIYPDGGGANLYLLGLIAEADTRARKEGGVPSTREEMGKELDSQKWWNDTIEELNLNKPEPKVISGGEVMEKLRVKKGGPWVKVILNCVHYEVKEEMLKKNKEDALQAATDHYNRILIWVNSQYEMLSDEKRRKTNKDIIWKYLLSGDPRELIKSPFPSE